jgi:flagellar protein FliL
VGCFIRTQVVQVVIDMAKSSKKVPKAPKPDAAGDTGKSVKASGGLIGMLAVAVAAGASAFGGAYLLSPAAPDAACTASADAEIGAAPIIDPAHDYVALPEFVISIGSAPATRFIKMSVSIVTEAEKVNAVHAAEPVLKDAFNTYLRSVEVSDFEDPAFYGHLRDQLAHRAEIVLGHRTAKGVLVTEFLLR